MSVLGRIAGAAGLLACLVLVPAAGSPAADGRGSGLERAIGGRYDASGEAQVAKAFRAALQAGIDERRALAIVATCIEGGFDAGELARALTLAAQLELQRLPIEAFEAKIEEGVAKRVASERVLRAAEARALSLVRAQTLVNAAVLEGLDARDGAEVLADVAAALEAGRAPEEVRAVLVGAAGEGVGEIRRRLFP